MEIDESKDFFGQPENTVQSDVDMPVAPANIDAISPDNMKQPATSYNFERGYRKEPGHPKFPWYRIIKQRDDGYITAELGLWNKCEELPQKNLKKLPFAFPWDILEIKTLVEDPIKLVEWNDVIALSMGLPFFIYTPTLFAMLMAAEEGQQPKEANWVPPVMLSSTVMRSYLQIMHYMNNDNLVTLPRREDIMRGAGEMQSKRMDLLTKVILQTPKFLHLAGAENVAQTLGAEFDEVYERLAEVVASHTHIYLRIMEITILRLCDMDAVTNSGLKGLFLESAVPDPEDGRISPFSNQLLDNWRLHNTNYTNRHYQIYKKPPPIAEGTIHQDDVRGLNKEALWLLLKLIIVECSPK